MELVLAAVDKANARLVVLDSLSEMRLLARDPLRFRRQILALKQYFATRQCTVLLLDDKTAPEGDLQLQTGSARAASRCFRAFAWTSVEGRARNPWS